MTTEDHLTPTPLPPTVHSAHATRRLSLPLAVIGVIVLLLVVGSAAALAVPIVSVTPDRTIAQMLPAGTAMYVSADLNPSGATRDNLDRIVHAFTDQPGWSTISKQFNAGMHGQGEQKQCVDQTQGQIQDHLHDLGHASAWAVLDGTNLDVTTPAGLSHLQNNMVLLASLDVHRTLVGALSGFHLSLQQTSTRYHGATIYQETFTSCGKVSGGAPNRIYAALVHGYVALGLRPQPIERVIDTASGAVPSLSTDRAYDTLMARLPADQLGGYYLSGQALKRLGLQRALRSLPRSVHVSPAAYNTVFHPTAGALSMQADGFRFVAASYAPSRTAAGPAAGGVATQLPSDTLALVSIQGLRSAVDNTLKQLHQQRLLTGAAAANADRALHDLTADLSGEVDLVLLRPAGRMGFGSQNDASVPLSLFWQVRSSAGARQHLADLAREARVSSQLAAGTAFDGTAYDANTQGYGYAVRQGWAIASLDIRHTIDALSPSKTLASNPAFTRGAYPGIAPTSLWYVDLHGLRGALEDSILPSVSPSERQQYEQYGRPLLTPLQSFSASAGTSKDGRLGLLTMFFGVSK